LNRTLAQYVKPKLVAFPEIPLLQTASKIYPIAEEV